MSTDEIHDAAAAAAGPAARAPGLFAEEDWSLRAWVCLLRDLYFTFDRRTLGFSRILLGFLLLMDVVHRGAVWDDMYSTIGVLPTALNLQRPQGGIAFSIFNGFSTPGELRVLWVIMAVNAVLLMVGYRTKVTQMVALVLHVGMNGRVLLVENGGYVVNNLLLLWTLFLPLGDRFSVDALLASWRRRREITEADLNDRSDMLPPGLGDLHVSALGMVLMIQIAAIYYFNVIHKTGPAWHDGTAVHYVLYVDRMATPIISALRGHVPNFLVIFMTRATMAFEGAIPVLLLQPLARTWARRGVVFMMCTLHLAFGTTFVLGPFAWSACVFATLLFSSEDWEIAAATMRRPRRARTVLFDPRSGGALAVCRLLKRLDRFELLTFAAVGDGGSARRGAELCPQTPAHGLPLGIGVQGQTSRSGMLADILDALPLGPTVAWIPRLPGVRALFEAALAGLEKRDVSGFFGLRVAGRAGERTVPLPETPRIPAWVVVVSALVVAGAVALAVYLDRPWLGVVLVLTTVVVTALGATWALYPVVTLPLMRKVAFGSLREFLILVMFVGAVDQACNELWCVTKHIKVPQPEALRLLTQKMRFLQGWFMFSPNPVIEDGTIVVDAITVDGRHIDPFTRKEPYWDLISHSLGLTQIWCDYFNRMQLPGNAAYREPMKDYMYRLPERTGRPEDAIVSGDVYWIKEMNPPWNSTVPYGYEKNKLFSFQNPAAQPHASR